MPSFFLFLATINHLPLPTFLPFFPLLLSPLITSTSTSISCFSPAIPVCLPFLHLSPLQELASIRRREQLVREAIVGKSPGVYSQLFKRFVRSSTHSTALQRLISSGHSQLGQIGLIGALVLTAFWWFILGFCLTLRVKWQVPKLFESNCLLMRWACVVALSSQLS